MSVKIHLGFITSNAGYDIPGSTLRHTLSNYSEYFSSTIVIDGALSKGADDFYRHIPNITVGNHPWTGRHVDQYFHRNSYVPEGEWLLALDCDECPTPELVEYLPKLISMAEERSVSIIGLPARDMWCKHNSDNFYCVKDPSDPMLPSKYILYKVLPSTTFLTNATGTHVTPSQLSPIPGAIKLPYYHFKSPETTSINSALYFIDDLDDPTAMMDLSQNDKKVLVDILQRHDLFSREKFRVATKSKSWPKELEKLVKTYKYNTGSSKYLYSTYFVFLGAGEDQYRLSYEAACSMISNYNTNYRAREADTSPLVIPHTPVMLEDITKPCGAG